MDPQDMGHYKIAYFYDLDSFFTNARLIEWGEMAKISNFGLFLHMKMHLIISFHKITVSYCFLIKHIKVTNVSSILKNLDMEYFIFHDIIHQKYVFATCPVWKYSAHHRLFCFQ